MKNISGTFEDEPVIKKMSQKTHPFGLRDKIGYACGDFANDFTFTFASNYLMIFYTDVFGISAALVGTMFLVARIIDAFTDVGMGKLVDTLPPTKEGRFRPWLKRMAIPMFIISSLMYFYPAAHFSYTIKVLYMFITYIIWGSVCYTSLNIPYGSMASVISEDPGERTSLSSFRTIGSMIASITVTIIAPLLLFKESGGVQVSIPSRFTMAGMAFGGIAMVAYFLCYHFSTERIVVSNKKSKKSKGFFALVKALLNNRALIAIIVACLTMLFCQIMSTSMNIYLFAEYFNSSKLMAVTSLAGYLPMLLMAPFARKLTERFGKKECSIVGVAVASIFYGLLFVIHTTNVWLYIILMLIASIGMGFFNTVIWAFITDIIDYQEVKTGDRDDGTVYAIYSFSRKLGQALAGGLGGFALSFVGYVSSAQQDVHQSQATLNGIYNINTGAPAIGYLIVLLILIFAYPLGKKEVEKNVAILKTRHEAQRNAIHE